MTQGYYRYPTVHGEKVLFISEDDLWEVPLAGGRAIRLTSSKGVITFPLLSPDGKNVVLTSEAEGHGDLYEFGLDTGSWRRLTYLDGSCRAVSWAPDGALLFLSDAKDPHSRGDLFELKRNSPLPTPLRLGPSHDIAWGDQGVVVKRGHSRAESAYWKRYRGGTAGRFFKAAKIDGEFEPFLDALKGNLSSPRWVGERLYFLSDHEGIGQVYSVDPQGAKIKAHTEMSEFYVRNIKSDGKSVVFHAGADLYRLNSKGQAEKIAVEFRSMSPLRARKHVAAEKYLQSWHMGDSKNELIIAARGKVFVGQPWEGAFLQLGNPELSRRRLVRFLGDRFFLCVSDGSNEDQIEVYDKLTLGLHRAVTNRNFGRITQIEVAPNGERIAFTNHKQELWIFDLEHEDFLLINQNKFGPARPFAWASDSRWIAYSDSLNNYQSVISLFSVHEKKSRRITRPMLHDFAPTFSADGRFLFFIGHRHLDPVYDSTQFELSFPQSALICFVTLQTETLSPFLHRDVVGSNEDDKKTSKGLSEIMIDFSGIEERVKSLPLGVDLYRKVRVSLNPLKAFYLKSEVRGARESNMIDEEPLMSLFCFDFTAQKKELWLEGVRDFELVADKLALQTKSNLRIIATKEKPKEKEKDKTYDPKSGWVNLDRIKAWVDPASEWKQMMREVWRLQKENFWKDDLGVDWEAMWTRYEPLIARIGSRLEFSDLVWELQGELGVSHAYEMGGDHRRTPRYFIGRLGAEIEWDEKRKRYRIAEIFAGDTWEQKEASPLRDIGLITEVGDEIIAIDGEPCTAEKTPFELLMGKFEAVVNVKIYHKRSLEQKDYTVTTLSSERMARYRNWVGRNERTVLERSAGKLGYVHVPNMGAWGFAEFHRYYLAAFDLAGLIIDVRYNGGGHVSQLLLEKLTRVRTGYTQSRWFGQIAYPDEAPRGPMVCLTNEYAGSDGDIFSHTFKESRAGPLIGKRTWGGVIGIWPRYPLVDGGYTSQPEFSFYFNNVGWGVENYGVDPDIEVEYLPHDYRRGKDPQLERAIQEALKLIK